MSKNTNIADLINYILVDESGNVVLTTGGQVATQSYVTTAVSNLVNAAPSTLDTLNELAAALGNDANFATTVTNSIATRLPLAGGTLTGNLNGTSILLSSSLTATRLIANTENSGLIVDLASRHGFMKYLNYGTGLVGRNTDTDGGISTWLGRFSGSITSPTAVFQDLVISNSGNVGIRNSNPYSPLTVTGAGISWGETVTYYPASNGYITLAFRLEGTDTTTGTWAIGKQSTIENGGVQYLQIAKNGLTGSTLHRPDAVQSFDPANGNVYFGFNVGIGTTSPFSFGTGHRTLELRGSSTSSIGALFVGNSNRSAVLGFYINPAAAGTVGTSTNHALQLVTNDIERVRISPAGIVTRPFQPAFLAYSENGGFTVTGGGWYNISNALTVESYDIGSNYSGGRFTAPVAGRYLFYAGGWTSIGSASNGERYAWSAVVNGGSQTFLTGGNYSLTDTPLSSYSIVYNLAAGDYVDLFVFSAVSGTWGAGTHRVFFGGYLL